MEVCESCHENDRQATGCTREVTDHYPYKTKKMIADCMICGKRKKLYLCPAYSGYNVRDTRVRKKK